MERHLFFHSKGLRLLGVLHTPDEGEACPAALVFLHGWAGYRIGPHQMFTKLARTACDQGFACLRFDFRGRGDSEGEAKRATLTTMIEDALAATEMVCAEVGVERVALIGDCSGSEVAIGAGPLDPRIGALVLWSAPIVGGERTEAEAAKRRGVYRDYLRKLFRRETWAKLVSGGLHPKMILKALRGGGKGAGEEGAEEDRQIDWRQRFLDFGGEALFIYGSNDPTSPSTAEHFRALSEEAGRQWHCRVVQGANHAFYSLGWEDEVMRTSLWWLRGLYPVPGEGGDHG